MGVSRVSWLGLIRVGTLTGLLGTLFAGEPVRSARAADHEPILGRFYNSYYYVVSEADYVRHRIDNVIRDMEGKVLARVSTAFKRAISVEGSGKLRDGRMINYADKVGGEVRFFVNHRNSCRQPAKTPLRLFSLIGRPLLPCEGRPPRASR